jgi:regulator of protease activity HflC (stomatin/prohibitin superfamily)
MAMSVQEPVAQVLPSQPVTEREAWSAPGVPVLVAGVVAGLAAIGLLAAGIALKSGGGTALIVLAVLVFIAAGLAFRGLTSVVAGQARVVQLFGRYRGTIREPGLHWVNPFADRRRVSTRIRNHETPMAKVNDADGNPIEIAAVVVWQVKDTAQALYSVDAFVKFVATQTETAVRHIASSYPYTTGDSDVLSLRENADEITSRLSDEISARVQAAGVTIIESRLEEEEVVELDEERKAAMVSNLLVVLCSEQATQQVVNTGSLYQ